MSTKLISTLLALFLFEYSRADLQCMNENGKPVDWFVLYKLPTMVNSKNYLLRKGLAYMYVTSDNADGDWTLSSISINDSNSIPGRTLDPLYSGNSANILTVLYNDEPVSVTGASIYGHTKGVVLGNEKEALWMIHSVPKFPLEPISPKTKAQNRYQYASNAVRYGQSFLCISLTSNQLDVLGTQLMYNKPKIYSSSIPDSIAAQYKNLTEVIKKKKSIKTAPWTSKATLRSRKGTEFTSYAKGSGFEKDLYSGWIAEDIGSQLWVETWGNGAGELPSDCKAKYHVMDVKEFGVKIDGEAISFKNSNDHSKWAVSDDKTKTVCIGDINRMTLSGRPKVMDDAERTGFSKHFNNQTLRGRANVARTTLGLSLIGVIFYKLFCSKKSKDNPT